MASNRTFKVETPEQSKAMLLAVLDGDRGPARDIVVLNAGVALYAADVVPSMAEGVALAGDTIASGKARAKLDEFVARTRALAEE
jgi:anthranilate phosphoribosyltransferase